MAKQLITYDLVQPGRDYTELFEAIKSLGGTPWHCLESVWIVVTDLTSKQVRDQLEPHIDGNDKLAVFSLAGGWATAGLPAKCNIWLRNNM